MVDADIFSQSFELHFIHKDTNSIPEQGKKMLLPFVVIKHVTSVLSLFVIEEQVLFI